ncbi:MAG: protein kinase domain-containing protein, partial [Planktothrix sp.]
MVWQSGQSLYGNRFIIQREIGKGRFGITYLVHNQQGHSWVIKTLKDEVMTDPEYAEYRDKYLRDFKDEALRLAICRHPHIVQIENVFHHDGFPCIVMEYIQGMDLGQRVKRGGPLTEAEALRYIQQVGSALMVVHEKGLLHRDVKPQNIMVRAAKDEAVLIDFGIAREFVPDLTQTHTFALTPGFAPIEQYDEQAHRGEYTDVYALAATLAVLVTGSNPPPSFMRAVRDRFQVPSGVSPSVQEAIKLGMAVQPEDRVRSMTEWLNLFNDVITSSPNPDSPKAERTSLPVVDLVTEITPEPYQTLNKMLAVGDWKAADKETAKIINNFVDGLLKPNVIKNFPCDELQKIDNLWNHYSRGKYGFGIQARIYVDSGGQLDGKNPDDEVWNKFGQRVGWRQKDWRTYTDIMDSNILSDAKGHFPCSTTFTTFFEGTNHSFKNPSNITNFISFINRIGECNATIKNANTDFNNQKKYQTLNILLASEEWKAADNETWRIILRLADKEETDFLDFHDLYKIPRSNFQEI